VKRTHKVQTEIKVLIQENFQTIQFEFNCLVNN